MDKDEQQAFLRAIAEDPDNDAPRLVYADWLDENCKEGQPGWPQNEHGMSARAEFIRVQCELAALPPSDPRGQGLQKREFELLQANRSNWDKEKGNGFENVPYTFSYERGFAKGLAILGSDRITQEDLAHLATLTDLKALFLCGHGFTDEGLAPLANFTQLQHLQLRTTSVTDEGLVHLANLTQLQRLRIWNSPVTSEGLERFAANSALPATLMVSTSLDPFRLTVGELRERMGITTPGANPSDAEVSPAQPAPQRPGR